MRLTEATRLAGLLRVAAGLLVATASAAAFAQFDEPDPDAVAPRSFAIPETRYAGALWQRAEDHVAAGRLREAIVILQELIEEHRGEVLGRRGRETLVRPSLSPVHPGASESARARLLELPGTRELYRDRFGAEAERALRAARDTSDRRALVEVARRWPLTRAAVLAWWSLGDLELELGNASDAGAAWRRAYELQVALGDELCHGARTRYELAESLFETGEGELALLAEGLDTANLGAPPSAKPTVLPETNCHSWRISINDKKNPSTDVEKSTPFSQKGESFNLFPVISGDTVLVSNSLQLLAVDAYAGTVRWRSDEAPGWDEVDQDRVIEPTTKHVFEREEFFGGVDRDSLMIAPAAGSGVALAALQIPVTQTGNRDFQQITITTVLPDRRLFAFDLETGEPLWNHMPPPGWDGESGTFSERTYVAGPPVVVGSRVLVPAYRLRGRVEYHAACYDLLTGDLLWSTALISGQLELNMFGRHRWEFTAPPLVVDGDRVIAQTQLGAIAALDLYTGDIRWETLYEQTPIPEQNHYTARRRKSYWQNAPPIVTEDQVTVVTPLDSEYMLGIDAETGRTLWAISHDRLFPSRLKNNERLALFGADESSVFLAGSRVHRCVSPSGLRSNLPPRVMETSDTLIDPGRSNPAPRPILTERYVALAARRGRAVLDRRDVRRIEERLSGPWRDGQQGGNAIASGGAFFALSGRYLTGFFEWEEANRRLAETFGENPGPETALQYGTFLGHRALDRRRDGRPLEGLRTLERAREVLEPWLEPESAPALAVSARLHAILRLEAQVLTDLGDSSGALVRLERARDLAPTPDDLRDVLMHSAELLAERDEPAWFEVLDELESRCAALALPDPMGLERPSDPETMNVGLWVQLQRLAAHARSGNAEGEFEVLHAVLAEYGDLQLPHDGDRLVSERIGELIERGAALEYTRFENMARELLERALQDRDEVALERIVALYPHSDSARVANDARLEFAYESGDLGTLAAITLAELTDEWHPRTATPREVQILLRMGSAFEREGNLDLANGILRSLARHHAGVTSQLDSHRGRSLAELAELSFAADEVAPPRVEPTFDEEVRLTARAIGKHALLGRVAVSRKGEAPTTMSIFLRDDALVAYGPSDPTRPAWSYPAKNSASSRLLERRNLLTPERVVIAQRREVFAVDPRTGELAWRWTPPEGSVDSVAGAGGLALLTVDDSQRSSFSLVAIDLATGLVIWRSDIPPSCWQTPVCGDHRVVLLPLEYNPSPAIVLDLYTGKRLAELDLGAKVTNPNHLWAWIEHGRLVLPYFRNYRDPERLYVAAFDLETGERKWRVAADDRELDSIVRHEGETYLVLLGGRNNARGAILELKTQLGSVREIQGVRLGSQDVPIGVIKYQRTDLDDPFLFVYSRRPEQQGFVVRAIHLPYGERWVHRIRDAEETPYNKQMPLPAMSGSTVALVYTEATGDRKHPTASTTNLLFLDRSSGLRRDSRILDGALGRAPRVFLEGIGDVLLIGGDQRMDVLRRR